MRFLALLHTPTEHPGMIRDWVKSRGHVIEEILLPTTPELPAVTNYDGLFVMGGPMGVYEVGPHPWLEMEIAFLRNAMQSRPVLGVCLGCQLLAAALGSHVRPSGLREIGWFPVSWTPRGQRALGVEEAETVVLHWHGDTFNPPEGSIALGYSAPGILQGFFFPPTVLALQFHLEVDESQLGDFIEGDAEYIRMGRERWPETVQDPASMVAECGARLFRTRELLDGLLDRWFSRNQHDAVFS